MIGREPATARERGASVGVATEREQGTGATERVVGVVGSEPLRGGEVHQSLLGVFWQQDHREIEVSRVALGEAVQQRREAADGARRVPREARPITPQEQRHDVIAIQLEHPPQARVGAREGGRALPPCVRGLHERPRLENQRVDFVRRGHTSWLRRSREAILYLFAATPLPPPRGNSAYSAA